MVPPIRLGSVSLLSQHLLVPHIQLCSLCLHAKVLDTDTGTEPPQGYRELRGWAPSLAPTLIQTIAT